MFILRPVRNSDFSQLTQLVSEAHHILNIPKNPDHLREFVEQSVASFNNGSGRHQDAYYIFVLEDLSEKKLGGMSALISNQAHIEDYYYEVVEENYQSKKIPYQKKIQILKPMEQPQNFTELVSLFMTAKWRRFGLGKLLSLGRLHYIARYPHRFQSLLNADICGYFDSNGDSPFWDGIGKHITPLNVTEVLKLVNEDRSVMKDLMLKYPVYLSFLESSVIDVIGKCHELSLPARTMLQQEGFQLSTRIDPIEGGSGLQAHQNETYTIKNSQLLQVKQIDDADVESKTYLLSTQNSEYRCTLGHVKMLTAESISVTSEISHSLNIAVGDMIRVTKLNPKIGENR